VGGTFAKTSCGYEQKTDKQKSQTKETFLEKKSEMFTNWAPPRQATKGDFEGSLGDKKEVPLEGIGGSLGGGARGMRCKAGTLAKNTTRAGKGSKK